MKYPDNVKRVEEFSAENNQAAYQEAMELAISFADDYLSNPNTGLTTVQLSSLNGPNGAISFDTSKSIVKRSMLEHLLSLASENVE